MSSVEFLYGVEMLERLPAVAGLATFFALVAITLLVWAMEAGDIRSARAMEETWPPALAWAA